MATTLEACRGRGRGDILASHDLEDVVAVADGRAERLGELAEAPMDVRGSVAAALGERLASA